MCLFKSLFPPDISACVATKEASYTYETMLVYRKDLTMAVTFVLVLLLMSISGFCGETGTSTELPNFTWYPSGSSSLFEGEVASIEYDKNSSPSDNEKQTVWNDNVPNTNQNRSVEKEQGSEDTGGKNCSKSEADKECSAEGVVKKDGALVEYPYVWNSRNQSAEEYLLNYCPERCSERNASSALCPNMQCSPCDCDESCQQFGERREYKGTTGCFHQVFGIIRCPRGWRPDSAVREACENGVGVHTVHEPVTDLTTMISFRNPACAACHGVTLYMAWQLEVVCRHFQNVYHAVSRDEFLLAAEKNALTCTVTRRIPDDVRQDCKWGLGEHDWFSVIDRCNVTGQWITHDLQQEIAENCLLLKDFHFRVHTYMEQDSVVFSNLFCARCNGVMPGLISKCDDKHYNFNGKDDDDEKSETGAKSVYPPLSLLVGFIDDSQEVADFLDTCGPLHAWLAPNNECRNLTCTPGKVIVNNTCSTAVTQIRGLMYNLNITLLPTSEVVIPFPVMAGYKLQEIFEQKLRPAAARYELNIKIAAEKTNNSAKPAVLFGVHISGDLTALRNITRDNAEQTLVQNIFSLIEFEFDGKNVSLRQASVVDELLVAAMDRPAVYTMNLPFQRDDLQDYISAGIPPEFHIPLSPILLCPYLELQPPEFEVRHPGNGTNVTHVVLKFGEEEVILADLEKAKIEGNTLKVCLETLESLPRKKTTTVEGLSWQYILSMVIIPLSIICLVLTLIVYSVLPVLRTEPGMNTMGTCCALLVAQVTLLLASHRVTSGVGCVVLGVVVHLSWLSMFCWTSVCSLHMFHVFSAKTYRGSRSGQCWRLLRNVLLTLLLPAVVVGVVVGVCYQTSGGATIGYSSLTCYLDSALLVGVAMVLPVSLMLVLNLALFILTARRIYMVTKLQPRAKTEGDSRQHLHVCARLSVLTGATWMLSLIAEGLGIDWLQTLAILANGGQGVMLFLSYVTTRRVATMLSVRLGLREKEVSSGKTQSTNDRPYSPGRSKNNTESAGNSIEMPLKT